MTELEFARLWLESGSIAEIAKACKTTEGAVRARAKRLRRHGANLPPLARGRRPVSEDVIEDINRLVADHEDFSPGDENHPLLVATKWWWNPNRDGTELTATQFAAELCAMDRPPKGLPDHLAPWQLGKSIRELLPRFPWIGVRVTERVSGGYTKWVFHACAPETPAPRFKPSTVNPITGMPSHPAPSAPVKAHPGASGFAKILLDWWFPGRDGIEFNAAELSAELCQLDNPDAALSAQEIGHRIRDAIPILAEHGLILTERVLAGRTLWKFRNGPLLTPATIGKVQAALTPERTAEALAAAESESEIVAAVRAANQALATPCTTCGKPSAALSPSWCGRPLCRVA